MSRKANESSEKDSQVGYTEKLVSVNRIAKVVKGGKRFSFSALVVIGDGKGRVGFATGKAREVLDAVKKASERARRQMIRVPLRESRTIHHDVTGHFGAGRVVLRAAPAGTGIIAGGAMRAVFEVLGVQDLVSKCIGSANPHNMVRSTFTALQAMMSPRVIASKRGKRVSDITSRRQSSQDSGK
ncbi:MAG: 30S ribosomal protein S5 [Holosporales bacterium]|jgi:small subunit ribosomal protein S5|nr:30S ribosomal protein S5 [Holosporales bacterium]